MSSRVTRSTARLNTTASNPSIIATPDLAARPSTTSNRKRKASAAREASLEQQTPSSAEPQPRKRARRSRAEIEAEQPISPARRSRTTRNFETMSSTAYLESSLHCRIVADNFRNPSGPGEGISTTLPVGSSSRRKPSKKKDKKGMFISLKIGTLPNGIIDVKEP